MVKLVYIVKRRDDVSPAEFHKYWLEKHGPLVRSFAKVLNARKYVQSLEHSVDNLPASERHCKKLRMEMPVYWYP